MSRYDNNFKIHLMKKKSLKTEIDLTFSIIIIVFFVLVYSTYNRAQLVNQSRAIVNHVSNVNDILEKIMASTVDIETGARGYVITGEEGYLSAYKKSDENLTIWIDSLQKINKTNVLQLQQLGMLKKLIQSKKKISAVMIEERRDEGMTAAAAVVKTGRGKELMDSIRTSISDNQKEALRSLGNNVQETEENVNARNNNFLLFTFVTLILLGFSYYQIRKNAKMLLVERAIQQNLMDELTVQNRQLNEFASITSHNLRSPAANITALIATIENDSEIEEYKSLFEMLKKVGQNLNDSLNQLMEVLHINRNKLIEKEQINFEDVFKKTTESLQGEILNSDATITADFTAAPHIMYSPIYLESIFHNLISNALKYRDRNRKPIIAMRTEIKGNNLNLFVTDNGIGIDLARHGAKIFGMNQRFTDRPDSKGIGLFMTKTQIESMNGKISVGSEPNVGSTFTIQFAL